MTTVMRVRARPELYVSMDLMAKEAIDPKEALRNVTAAGEGLHPCRMPHRRRRGDRPPIRDHRRLHLSAARRHGPEIQEPLRYPRTEGPGPIQHDRLGFQKFWDFNPVECQKQVQVVEPVG